MSFTSDFMFELRSFISEKVVKTPEGTIFMPGNRPNRYFSNGSDVICLNINIYSEDGEETIPLPEEKEGILHGTVTCESSRDDKIVCIKIGQHEYQFMLDCPLIMHSWEYDRLLKDRKTRKLWSFVSEGEYRYFIANSFKKAFL